MISVYNEESVKKQPQKFNRVDGFNKELSLKLVGCDVGTIEYQEKGEGRALLFIHGALSNNTNWKQVFSTLSKKNHCIAPNFPFGGHALPLNECADLSPTGICHLLNQFIQKLNLVSVTIVANDTGGAYAQIFAANHPERVDALILSNCDALDIFPPKQFSSLPKWVNFPGYLFIMGLMFRNKAFLKSNMALGLLSNKLSKEEIAHDYIYHFIRNARVRADFQKVVNGWSITYTLEAAEKLKAFNKPVSIIWGSEDTKLFPEELGRRLNDIFPNSEFHTVQDARTYVQVDQSNIFLELVSPFLDRM